VDGFGSLDNQNYANAYIYMGVTSLGAVADPLRHHLNKKVSPGPALYPYELVGTQEISTEEMLKQIEEFGKKGARCIILLYKLKPEQIDPAVKKIHEMNMVAIGELGYASYREALSSKIDAFIHFSRYSLELVPPEMHEKVAMNPWGKSQRACEEWLSQLNPDDPSVGDYAKAIASSSLALMPTLILRCNDLPDMENPWREPVASILSPADINRPVDQETGKHRAGEEMREHNLKFVENMVKIERQYHKAGAKYLAGSATDVNGTMPGISLHQELELLTRIGLSNREALAATTGNYRIVYRWLELGEIKAGRRADMLVVEKSPLEDIQNLKTIRMVVLKGKIIDRKRLLTIKKSTTRATMNRHRNFDSPMSPHQHMRNPMNPHGPMHQ